MVKYTSADVRREAEAYKEWKEAESKCRFICPKESAALRRTSMELTRALAKMRRP